MKADFFAFLPPGQHPGMDALARGLAAGVTERGGTLRIRCSSNNDDESNSDGAAGSMTSQLRRIIMASNDSDNKNNKLDAVFLFITAPHQPDAALVQEMMQAGIRVYTIHRPWYPVTASVVVPNFYQGVTLANRLAQALLLCNNTETQQLAEVQPKKIAILGGPAIVDDEELVLGCLDGARRAKFVVLNDPFETRYRNLHDVKGASKEIVQRIFDDFLSTNKDNNEDASRCLDGLIVFNDETMYDVLAYLKEKQLLGTFPIVSRNGSPDAIQWVKKGWTTATLDYKLPEIGRLAASLLDGDNDSNRTPQGQQNQKQASSRVIMAPFGTLYDTKNVEEYVSWETRAPMDIKLNVLPPEK